jgi:plastocyanin
MITETETVRVAAGGGNATIPLIVFVLHEVTIKAGQTVTWDNPTAGAAEPHTVTFMLDSSTVAGVISPLAVSNATRVLSYTLRF